MSPLDENLLDDNLTPLERLEKFYATEEIFERQDQSCVTARILLDSQFFEFRDLAVREIPIVIETIGSINEFEKLCYIADKLARDTGIVYVHFAQ